MHDDIRIDPRQLENLRKSRGWNREQLLENAGIHDDDLERAEADGKAPAALAMALANTLEISPAMLDGDSPQALAGRRRVWSRVAIGLGIVLALSLLFGYRAGSDVAMRDNYRDCIAAGGVNCQRL